MTCKHTSATETDAGAWSLNVCYPRNSSHGRREERRYVPEADHREHPNVVVLLRRRELCDNGQYEMEGVAMATPELSNKDAQRLREFERRSHDQLAGSYCDFFTSVTTLAAEPLLDAAEVAFGVRVLDVATGPGSLVAAAVHRGAQPVGVDLSSKMIELARQRYPSIEFHEADVERLPFPEQIRRCCLRFRARALPATRGSCCGMCACLEKRWAYCASLVG
jgi:SAM-dependent methyltransferase